MSDRVDQREFRVGRCIVRTWRRPPGNLYTAFPWLFSVQEDGKDERRFIGIPNYCGTRREASMRGLWRARWLNDGTFHQRYR